MEEFRDQKNRLYKAIFIIKHCHKMQNPSLRKDELRARKIYLYTFYFCAATMLIIFTYALVPEHSRVFEHRENRYRRDISRH